MNELVLQTREVLDGKEVTKDIFPFQVSSLSRPKTRCKERRVV